MKLQKIAAVSVSLLLCTTILAGCSGGGSGTEVTSAAETSSVTETDSETEVTTETASGAETSSATETEAISEINEAADGEEEEDYAEPVEEPFVVTEKPIPENAHVYEYDDENPPEMPEFSMSLDGYHEFTQSSIARTRFEIKAMLECAQTGEIPMIKSVSGGYTYECRRIEGVTIGDWTVKDEKYTEEPYTRYEVTLSLDITESESEFMPVGTADYLLIYYPGEDRAFLPLRKVGEFDESRLLPAYGDDAKEYVNFCTYYTAYFRDWFSGDTVTDFSAPNFGYSVESTVFCAYVAASRGGGFQDIDTGIIPYSEYNETLEKILGFSADAINAKSCMWYNADTDSIEIPGRGHSWICGWLAEDAEGEEEGTRVVTIDYYEDDFYLVKSQTYRYTLRINDDGTCSMLKVERLYKSDRGILGGTV